MCVSVNIVNINQSVLEVSNFSFFPGYSSVGRAVDCRSIGHLFKSGCPDVGLNKLFKYNIWVDKRGCSSNGRAHA